MSAPESNWKCIGPFHYDPSKLHARQLRRLQEILPFYTDATIARLLMPVATATFDVSLRLLDYCCTNYAKKTRVVICDKQRALHLWSFYKDWLRHYRRRCFDPFRRRERICFRCPVDANKWHDTTVAQLNFLRWAEVYGVIAYVRRNIYTIEQDMMSTLVESKKRRLHREVHPRKRTELSRAPRSKCTVYLVPTNLVFD